MIQYHQWYFCIANFLWYLLWECWDIVFFSLQPPAMKRPVYDFRSCSISNYVSHITYAWCISLPVASYAKGHYVSANWKSKNVQGYYGRTIPANYKVLLRVIPVYFSTIGLHLASTDVIMPALQCIQQFLWNLLCKLGYFDTKVVVQLQFLGTKMQLHLKSLPMTSYARSRLHFSFLSSPHISLD